MQARAVGIAWSISGILGTIATWIVLTAFSTSLGSWFGPMLFAIAITLIQLVFLIGNIWDLDSAQMPREFCIAQIGGFTFLALEITSLCALLSWLTTTSVLWPQLGSQLHVLRWRTWFILPLAIWPAFVTILQVSLMAKTKSVVYSSGSIHCNIASPLYLRLIGFAGAPAALAIPSSIFFLWAIHRISQMYNVHRQLAQRILANHRYNRSSPVTRSEPLNDIVGTISRFDPVHDDFSTNDHSDSPSEAFATHDFDREHGDEPYESYRTLRPVPAPSRFSTDAGAAGKARSSSPSTFVAYPPSHLDESSHPGFTLEKRPRVTITVAGSGSPYSPGVSAHSRRTTFADVELNMDHRPVNTPDGLLANVWRLLVFQGIYVFTVVLLSITTLDSMVRGIPPPAFSTDDVCLLLAAWSAVIVFGHTPGVRKQFKIWYTRLFGKL